MLFLPGLRSPLKIHGIISLASSHKKKLLPAKPVEVIGPRQDSGTFDGELHRPLLFKPELLLIKTTKKSMSPVQPVSLNSLFSSLVDPSFNSNLMESVRESFPQPERSKPLPDEEFSSSYPGSLLWSLRFIPILVGEFPQKF